MKEIYDDVKKLPEYQIEIDVISIHSKRMLRAVLQRKKKGNHSLFDTGQLARSITYQLVKYKEDMI